MRVMVLVKATEESEAGVMPSAALMDAMSRYNEDLIAAGIRIVADGLKPSSFGKRIAIDGDRRTVSNGPFPRPTELVAGYWIWEVKDMDEAVAWAKRCPQPMPVPSEIEIRPFYTLDDLAAARTGSSRV